MHISASGVEPIYDPQSWSFALHFAGWTALAVGAIGIGFGIFNAIMAVRGRRDPDELTNRIRAAAFGFFSGVAIASIPTFAMIVPDIVKAAGSMSDRAADGLWKVSVIILLGCIVNLMIFNRRTQR